MEKENLGKIKDLISQSKTFALISGENQKENILLAREAMRIFLERKGLIVYLFPESPDSFKDKWGETINIFSNPELPSSTSIRIPKNNLQIKEISYEEDDNFFTFNINSGANKINKDSVFFETNPRPVDAGICLCLSEETSINYPIKKENLVFINPDKRKASEEIFDIIHAVEPNILLQENPIFSLLCLSLAQERLLSLIQILGRAMARSRANENNKSLWTFMPNEDLVKTNNEDAGFLLFYNIIYRIQENLPEYKYHILLWQKEKEVNVIFLSENKDRIFGPFKNFSEAELEMQKNIERKFLMM